MAASIDDVLSTTIEKWARTDLADNIFDSNALFYLLRDQQKSYDGGTAIWEPLMYGKSSAVDSYSSYETLNVSAQQGVGRAEFSHKQYAASIVIDGYSEMRNAGAPGIINLLEEKTSQAKMSLYDRFNTDLFGDGTGNGSKNLDGLGIAIDSTGTYGGLLRSTCAWWAANETAVSGALTIARMRTAFNDASAGGRNGEHPNLVITTQSQYEAYEGLLQPDQRFTDNKLGDGGFQNITFKGQPVVWDEACTSGVMFFINSKYMKFRYHSQRNFATRPFVTPANQDAKVALVLWMGNLTASNCRRQTKLTGLT